MSTHLLIVLGSVYLGNNSKWRSTSLFSFPLSTKQNIATKSKLLTYAAYHLSKARCRLWLDFRNVQGTRIERHIEQRKASFQRWPSRQLQLRLPIALRCLWLFWLLQLQNSKRALFYTGSLCSANCWTGMQWYARNVVPNMNSEIFWVTQTLLSCMPPLVIVWSWLEQDESDWLTSDWP